jgi:hypothetical protein
MSYLFFYENYSIFKTEQLCANLYRLMEMIFISRNLKKTLVLPNFYFTPRLNELINKTDELHIERIEFIDVSNIIQIDKLKLICDIISVSEYFKILSKNSLKTIVISKPNEDVPINRNKYHTIYGTIPYQSNIEIRYSSLQILNELQNEDRFKEYKNIIIHNYNRMGNPIWYKTFHDEYYTIRNSLKFNESLISRSNLYKGIDYDNTLLVHWRRGDFKLSNLADEEESKEYYKRYNELNDLENLSKNILVRCLEDKIKSVFLLTNETNEEDLQKLSYILTEFDINLIMYGNSSENNYLKYVVNDICGIIIGSKCKYQLYGGSYDRMSQYGRWIQEEYLGEKNISYLS